MPLPTDIDATYPDRDSGDALHQQHHDTVHAAINDPAANWPEGNAAYLRSPSVATVITVGAGGDFATIAEALVEASRYRPLNGVGSAAVEVSLLTGFVMSEQVTVENIDLGHVVITSVDATVTIARSALTVSRIDGPAAFFGVNATMPIIAVLFSMDTSGVAADQCGFNLSNTHAAFRSGAGCQNATGRGLNAHHASIVYGPGSVWSGCSIGVRIANGSVAHLRNMTATGCTSRAVSTSASFVDVKDAVLTGATNRALEGTDGSVVIAANADVTGYTATGIRASGGSIIDAVGVLAQKSVGSDATTDLGVLDGGILNVKTASGGLSQTANKLTGDGIILDSAKGDAHPAGNQVVVGAPALGATQGAPALVDSTAGGGVMHIVWAMDDSTSETVAGQADLSQHDWQTFDIVLYWTNLTANAGAVFWQVRYQLFGGTDTLGIGTAAAVTPTAAGQYVVSKTTLASGVTLTPDKLAAFRVQRAGGQAGDTLTGDAGILAVAFVKAT